MYVKNAVLFQRPRILIFSSVCPPWMASDMAAPDLIDLVPISLPLNPYLFAASGAAQTLLRSWVTLSAVTSSLDLKSCTLYEQTVILLPEGPGKSSLCLRITLAHAAMGHRTGSPDRRWDLRSILVPFFWSTKHIVTNSALSDSSGSSWLITALSLPRNVTFSAVSRFVLPGVSVLQNSHARMAKK